MIQRKDSDHKAGRGFSMQPRVILFLLTLFCVASMGYHYIRQQNIVSVSQAAGMIVLPVQKGLNTIGSFLYESVQEKLELQEALDKLEQLEEENKVLTDQMSAYDQNRKHYEEVLKLLELKDLYGDYETSGANVILSSSSGNWFSTFVIDKGSEDGIAENMNVVADGGLVGLVIEVASHHAVVSTIINDNSNVSGMQLSTGDSCIVEGDLTMMAEDGHLRLTYMDTDFDISEDTVIVTSQISDRYLPGIVIGYASDVQLSSNKLSCNGFLTPAVDFKHLSEVLVIKTLKQNTQEE